MSKVKDLTNKRFGRLTAKKRLGKNNYHVYLWECVCDCGNTKVANTNSLMTGNVSSCGCLAKEVLLSRSTTHGLSSHRLYRIHQDMIRRCYNPNNKGYKYYGGRGIKVCDEWRDFVVFYAWAISHGYEAGLTIERIDNDGDYSPENCRWITQNEQCRNRRSSRLITFRGETKCLMDFTDELGLPYHKIKRRLYRGWSVTDAFTKEI